MNSEKVISNIKKAIKEHLDNNYAYDMLVDFELDVIDWNSLFEYIDKLQQENTKLKERIEYLERSNNRREDTILEQRQEISNLKDNWNELKNFLKNTRKENLEWDKKHKCEWKGYNAYSELLIKMQEIEKGSDK